MSTVTKCTCGHLISEHSYSDSDTGCDLCKCTLDLGELIDKYAKEVADRTEQNLQDMKHIQQLENFIRTRNIVCTWCGFKVVYDNENEEEKQTARDAVNAHALVCEKDPRTIQLKQVEANYKALQTPMPCGHLARYAVNGEEGTQYCSLCDREALMTASEVAANVLSKTADCVQLLREVNDRVPGLLYDHYDENTVSLGVRINNAIIELDKVNNQ